MNTKYFLLSIIAVLISFIGGFLLANSLNRNELSNLKGENERLKNDTQTTQNTDEATLSEDEIKSRIAEADKNPQNFEFQKSLGVGLYRYAAFKKDADLLAEVSRILIRANELEPKDYEVLVALGNTNFDIGYFKQENEKFEKAREYYLKALSEKPDDVDVRTDYGLTFYLTKPPEVEQAITELEKSLKLDPKHERTLQVLVEAYLAQNNFENSEKTLAKLEEVNPKNTTISPLRTKISQVKSGSAK